MGRGWVSLKSVNVWVPLVAVVVVALAAIVVVAAGADDAAAPDGTATSAPADTDDGAGGGTDGDRRSGPAQVVRDNSHRLSSPAHSSVTFVEFLDFECEACGALYPIVEQLRETYGDRVTFVARYFPLPGHFNSERAARAVEAAAQQGEFEAMYHQMFTTQAQWGEQQVPLDDLFRSYAEDLDLDMEAFDAAYDDPATLARIREDQADGRALGVDSTPTLFLNGERLEPESVDDLVSAIDTALEDA